MPATVCLNVIVKNKGHVIRRCLDSTRPLVDHWLIVDIGSIAYMRVALRND